MNSYLAIPIFRSWAQAEILRVVLSADHPITTREVVAETGCPQPTVHREATRLVESGLFLTSSVGRSTLYSADDENPLIPPLRSLVTIATGPQHLLRAALRDIPGITYAAIFGSFAARAAGIGGKAPRDIDVVIVGTPERKAVYAAVAPIESSAHREVNLTFLSPDRWAHGEEEIVSRIQTSPVLELTGQ